MQPSKSLHILIAEDDPDDRMLIEKAFSRGMKNVSFTYVENGEELMLYLQRIRPFTDAEKHPWPNMILLDLNMPKKDGRQALQEIKSSAGLCKIPVVVFTTSQSLEDLNFTYEAGGNSYIVKPSSFEELIRIGRELEQYWHQTVRLPE